MRIILHSFSYHVAAECSGLVHPFESKFDRVISASKQSGLDGKGSHSGFAEMKWDQFVM